MSEVIRFTDAVVAPIHWQDATASAGTFFPGGSCFFLRFPEKLVGVTANHVLTAYEIAVARAPGLPFQIGKIGLNIRTAAIDRDADLDIATFVISETELQSVGAIPIDCRTDWPPPVPKVDRVLSLAGFPEAQRTIAPNGRVEFRLYSALPMVDAISDTEIIVTHEQDRDRAAMDARPNPPPRFNMSGCSGGPVIMHGTRNGVHIWYAVGLIIQGPGALASGDAENFEMIRIRRIDCLRADGTIARDTSGWLPPRSFVDPRGL